MAKINLADKISGQQHSAAEFNIIKRAINQLYPVPEAFQNPLIFNQCTYMPNALAQAGIINYALGSAGHEDGMVKRHKILADGNAINFPAGAFVYPSSRTYEAGQVYEIWFTYLGGDLIVNVPALMAAGTGAEEPAPSNSSPTVSSAIADQARAEGYGSFTIDLSAVFADADSDPLTYSATSSNTAIATVGVSGSILTVTEVAGTGTVNITVTANDGNGGTAQDVFGLTVNTATVSNYVTWEQFVNAAQATNGGLQLSGTPAAVWENGAYASRALSGDNALHVRGNINGNQRQAIALSNTYAGHSVDGINTDIWLNLNGELKRLYVFEDGVQVHEETNFSFSDTTLVTVKLTVNTVTVEVNGSTIYTSAKTFTKPLNVIGFLHGSFATSKLLETSFDNTTNLVTSTI